MDFIESLRINCLSHWYPRIQGVVPTPETRWVKLSNGWPLVNIFEGEKVEFMRPLVDLLLVYANEVGGEPIFLRTGQGSGKHNWKKCCHVTDTMKIEAHVMALVEWSHLVSMMGLPHDVWVVREMLKTAPVFDCQGYGNMPVVREWRYFVEDGKALYGVPYWPEKALEEGGPNVPNWREFMVELDKEPSSEVQEMAEKAGAALGGLWSVDCLQDRDGKWFVTDMAVGETSYGWSPEKAGKGGAL